MLKHTIRTTIWVIIGLYATIIILLHVPSVQAFVGARVADALCQKFGTKVSIGRIDLGFINRLIIDDTQMQDKRGEQMLRVSRLSVKINPLALANGQIEITSAQFFGLRANLYKATAEAKPNFQFVVDSLASKDTTKQKTPLDLQINSLIIRNGNVRWRVLSRIDGKGTFSPSNIDVRNISAHIILNRVTDDSLNVKVKRIALDERCGLHLKSLSLHAIYGPTGARLENLNVELPRTTLQSRLIEASFRKDSTGGIDMPTLRFEGSIEAPRICLADMAGFEPRLARVTERITLAAKFHGTGSSAYITSLGLATDGGHIRLSANGGIRNYPRNTTWFATIDRLSADSKAIATIVGTATGKDAPAIIGRIGDIALSGHANGSKKTMAASGKLQTSIGSLRLALGKSKDNMTAHVETSAFDIGQLAGDKKLGHLSANIDLHGKSKDNLRAKGRVYDLDYNGYRYRDISIDASYINKIVEGKIDIDDPNAQITASGLLDTAGATPSLRISTSIGKLAPHALRLTGKWPGTSFTANVACDIKGTSLNNADGNVSIGHFAMRDANGEYSIDSIRVATGFDHGTHFMRLDSDFGTADISGHFSYNTIARSVLNMVAAKLPTIPGLTRQPQKELNDFTLNATISDTQWMRHLLGVPLDIHRPLNISGEIDDRREKIDLWCDVPSFAYDGKQYADAFVNIESPGDTLKADIRIRQLGQKGKHMDLSLKAGACDNRLSTTLSFANNDRQPLRGTLNASTIFAKDDAGRSTAYIDVLTSHATIGKATWNIHPAHIEYRKNNLQVDNFRIEHDGQYMAVDGTATPYDADSIVATLNDIDVNYVLGLVNFHSVEFDGMASGKAYVAKVFGGKPHMAADLRISNFRFENGRMGTLLANVAYDDNEGRIDIDAVAHDDDNRRTDINGYVSPRHNYIDLAIAAHRTRAEFMESFCGSFMDNVQADIDGEVNVVGPLSNINLVGKAAVNGSMHLTALNTTYWLRNDSVVFVPDEIKLMADTLYDRNGNIGVMSGSLRHQHLTNLSYDINVKAHNLLAYDTHTFGGNTFYGTAFITGDCRINGRSGEVTIDVDGTPEKNSILVYNVADQTSLGSDGLVKWKTHTMADTDSLATDDQQPDDTDNMATSIRINMLINCTPNATLKLLMDEHTGDYITLNGEGVLRANYFNKGAFEMYGNYTIDHGLYKLTIQNVIKKEFTFESGGTIAFGGDPYRADLNLKAMYVLNSVSLADLNVGRSFANNNVRVNCLMNITGTPGAPNVDFDLDMPSLDNDAKQMIYSLLNAEEQRKQQVLYLLAVGRFYAQGSGTQGETSPQYSQTSLAMQSLLSGTISQQISSVLSNAINSNNWNFGANISTGTEGFNNAEYEGILSGRLLNNRLLINGQFGYRDNANATTSFIGDFDIRYLLFPNGNLAINVYNKTNDRYFTRNSMNTQGIGFIMKKDFTKLSELFFWRKKKSGKADDGTAGKSKK